MTICKECGVELEDDMNVCPLCQTPVGNDSAIENSHPAKPSVKPVIPGKQLLQRILWQVTSVLLLSAIIGTLIIDLTINQAVTWSIYPVSICLMIFSYASLVALWHTRIVFQLLTGWIISTLILMLVNMFGDKSWPLTLAFPILCTLNVTGILLTIIFTKIKIKSLNVFAIIFVCIAVVCLIIDGIITFHFTNFIKVRWSVIVAACLLPVTAALLFMYYKTRNNKDLQKIFHT
jgi:hypothetical protein